MKLSAQVSAFIVMVAAILGMALYVNAIDIDTDVSTLEETLLPNEFSGENLSTVTGFAFRYPPRWEVTVGAEDEITLQTAANDAGESQAFTLAFEQSEEPIESLDALFDTTESAEVIAADDGIQAARAVTPVEGGVNVHDVRILTENDYLNVTSTSPISAENWDLVRPDLDRVLNSIKAEDFQVLQAAFTYELPDDTWRIQNENKYFFIAVAPADAAQPESGMQVAVFPRSRMLSTLAQILPLSTTPSPDDNPIDVIRGIDGSVQDPNLTLNGEPEDAEYFGLEGSKVNFTASFGDLSYTVLDGGEDYYVLIIQQVTNGDNHDAHAEGLQAILDSVEYTIPNPAVFQDQ